MHIETVINNEMSRNTSKPHIPGVRSIKPIIAIIA